MEKFRVRSRWVKMLSRCEDEDNPQYHDYGGRGIYVCEEWHDFNTFYDWCIANHIETSLQLDRINNDGPYDPNNCKFSTRSANARNKRSNRMLTAFGETKCLIEWSEDSRCEVSHATLLTRVSRGWSDNKAITMKPSETRAGRNVHNAQTYEAFGEFRLLKDWVAEYPVPRATFHWRIRNGWSVEEALTGKRSH